MFKCDLNVKRIFGSTVLELFFLARPDNVIVKIFKYPQVDLYLF